MAFGLSIGIASPLQAEPNSPAIETASVVSAPPDFRLASINPSLSQVIDEAPDYAFLIESDSDIDADGKVLPHWYNHFGQGEPAQITQNRARQRFDAVAEKADLSPAKLVGLFDKARADTVGKPKTLVIPEVAPARFASASATVDIDARLALAYADPSPAPTTGALGAIARMTSAEGNALDTAEAEDALPPPDQEGLSEQEVLPSAAPLPGMRPLASRRAAEAPVETLKPGEDRREAKFEPRRDAPKRQQLAYARPDNPEDQSSDRPGWGLKNLFGRPRAGRGVAVYDISSAKVYMPDGSVLEAHSGIGKMADNPKYVHVKMNGPTPPSTYNLRMRESRFHGVEAIRMLPVDGKNPHGRTGLLTHSYLLRGGRAESHGCVAFKDYNKFLTAFKKGKVKQLVVVPGGGRTTLFARNG
ncbi:MAG: DUF2778 domain-containing protein [Rhizobiaceae bacterium]